MSAVQKRDRQQVQDRQAQRQHGQDRQIPGDTLIGVDVGRAGDRDRAGDGVLDGNPAGECATDHADQARLDALRADRAAIAAEVRAHVGAGAPHRAPDDAARVDGYLAELELRCRGWAQRGVTRLLRPVLGAVFAPPAGDGGGAGDGLDARLEIGGDVAAVQAVGADALVFAPTHGANLDAIVLGMALARLGLPPALYLAGEHLCRNPLVGRLMGPLGAVRIDRGRADRRYLAVLTAYVAALAARGAALTIFPGATRRRDGTLEDGLRLGLIAAAARAAAARGRRVHVVPVTINSL